MKGADLLKMLENAGVKADELKWTGLEDLRGRDNVTPEQVREVLAQDRLKLTEGHEGMMMPARIKRQAQWRCSMRAMVFVGPAERGGLGIDRIREASQAVHEDRPMPRWPRMSKSAAG